MLDRTVKNATARKIGSRNSKMPHRRLDDGSLTTLFSADSYWRDVLVLS